MSNVKHIQAAVGEAVDLNFRVNGGGTDACVYELVAPNALVTLNAAGGVLTATDGAEVVVRIKGLDGQIADFVSVRFLTAAEQAAIDAQKQNVLTQAGGFGYGNGGFGAIGFGL